MDKNFIDLLTQAVQKNELAETFAETILPKLREAQTSSGFYDRESTLRKLSIDKLAAALPSKSKLQFLQIEGSGDFQNKARAEIKKLPLDVQCFVHARCALFELSPRLYRGIFSPRGKVMIAVANDLTGWDFQQTLYHELAHAYLHHEGGPVDELEAVELSNKWL